tara:strand:+ start:382 stop:696 length:315 start_codon:yes stop_codon:yes gene_type:complete
VGHLQENGFDVTLIEVDDVGVIQEERGVAEELRGCHAAKVGDYLVEGHVPADLLKRFLEEDEGLAGITVPGMIVGPPGMEGSKPMPYDVLTFDQKGNSRIYESR